MVWHNFFTINQADLSKVWATNFLDKTQYFSFQKHNPHRMVELHTKEQFVTSNHINIESTEQGLMLGNIIDYTGEVTTTTADITISKSLINSTISTPDTIIFVCRYRKCLSQNTTGPSLLLTPNPKRLSMNITSLKCHTQESLY